MEDPFLVGMGQLKSGIKPEKITGEPGEVREIFFSKILGTLLMLDFFTFNMFCKHLGVFYWSVEIILVRGGNLVNKEVNNQQCLLSKLSNTCM